MEPIAALAFANQLRAAREAALKDAEAFDEIIHTIERLGSFLTQKCTGLGDYRDELEKVALTSAMAEEAPKLCGGMLTPFCRLYDLVQDARNDALHQGAFARHLTVHAIELALILEDALRSSEEPRVSDYMIRNPLLAELWQPISNLNSGIKSACQETDKPSAALIKDLKRRGLLDSTLVHIRRRISSQTEQPVRSG